eukprot:4826387-Pleurochrysis_carterae.AAC.12
MDRGYPPCRPQLVQAYLKVDIGPPTARYVSATKTSLSGSLRPGRADVRSNKISEYLQTLDLALDMRTKNEGAYRWRSSRSGATGSDSAVAAASPPVVL